MMAAEAAAAAMEAAETAAVEAAEAGMRAGKTAHMAARPAIGMRPVAVETAAIAMAETAMIEIPAIAIKPAITTKGRAVQR